MVRHPSLMPPFMKAMPKMMAAPPEHPEPRELGEKVEEHHE